MADRTRTGLNMQKRGLSVFHANLVEADILTTGSTYGTLPQRVVVQSASILVTTVSTTATSTLDIKVGSTVVANEVAVTAAGMIDGTMVAANQYHATGGVITVLAGAVTPAAGDFVGELIIEYIELDKVTGEYTVMTNS
jgi:hypothetical protein